MTPGQLILLCETETKTDRTDKKKRREESCSAMLESVPSKITIRLNLDSIPGHTYMITIIPFFWLAISIDYSEFLG